jgi:hypothetical protein
VAANTLYYLKYLRPEILFETCYSTSAQQEAEIRPWDKKLGRAKGTTNMGETEGMKVACGINGEVTRDF